MKEKINYTINPLNFYTSTLKFKKTCIMHTIYYQLLSNRLLLTINYVHHVCIYCMYITYIYNVSINI